LGPGNRQRQSRAPYAEGAAAVTGALQFLFQDTTVKNYLARDPTANSLTYTPWDGNQNALYAMAALNDATSTDIRPFIDSGAKLILWHGGNDAALSVNSTAEYHANMRNTVGAANADASTRFYVAPESITARGAQELTGRTCLPRWISG
jgi:feruloyl esterase